MRQQRSRALGNGLALAVVFVAAMLLAVASSCDAFVVRSSSSSSFFRTDSSALSESEYDSESAVILPNDFSKAVDPRSGGVRLAEDLAIKFLGTILPGTDPKIQNMIRYDTIVEIDEATAKKASIIAKGTGVELYEDPDEKGNANIFLGPSEAVKDALKDVDMQSTSKIVLNFLGGDDLMLFEVTDAAEEFATKLSVDKNTEITFNSIAFKDIADGTCSIVAVAMNDDASDDGLSGIEKSIAQGEVYFYEGKWWTVSEDDINTDEE